MEAPQLFTRLWTNQPSPNSPQGKLILPRPRDTLHDILDDYDQQDDDDDLPPAPPPKDPGYHPQFSRSQTSLIPPRTPYSAHPTGSASNLSSSYVIAPAQSSPSPSSSQPSLASPSASSPTTLSSNVKAAVSKFRLPRLKRKPSALGISSVDPYTPPASVSTHSDDGISQPWNFQVGSFLLWFHTLADHHPRAVAQLARGRSVIRPPVRMVQRPSTSRVHSRRDPSDARQTPSSDSGETGFPPSPSPTFPTRSISPRIPPPTAPGDTETEKG